MHAYRCNQGVLIDPYFMYHTQYYLYHSTLASPSTSEALPKKGGIVIIDSREPKPRDRFVRMSSELKIT